MRSLHSTRTDVVGARLRRLADIAARDVGIALATSATLVEGRGREADHLAGRRAVAEAAGAQDVAGGRRDDGRVDWAPGWTGSISHGAGVAVAVLARVDASDPGLAPGVKVGVDVERSAALPVDDAASVLGASERARVDRAVRLRGPAAGAALATVIWSLKEATFKAWSEMTEGAMQRVDVDPVDVEVVEIGSDGRATIRAHGPLADVLGGGVATVGLVDAAPDLVLTLVWTRVR